MSKIFICKNTGESYKKLFKNIQSTFFSTPDKYELNKSTKAWIAYYEKHVTQKCKNDNNLKQK